MFSRISAMACVLVVVGCGGGGSGNPPEEVAIAVTGLGAAGFNYTQGTYIVGFVFRANEGISIRSLGFYDSNLTGTAETFGTHDVGVYDLTTSALLTSVTVSAADPVTGVFHYRSLTPPLVLGTSDTYAVVGVTGTSYYTVGITTADAPVNAALTYVSGAGYSTTATSNAPTQTSSLVLPNAFDVGNIFGQAPPANILADFGPNFTFTPGG